MIYFKLNEEISNWIKQIPEVKNREITLGCKSWCKVQVIALDELQLMVKLLRQEKIKDFTSEEFKELKNTTSPLYFRSTHVCTEDEDKIPKPSQEEENEKDEKELKELFGDKIPTKQKYHFKPQVDYDIMNKINSQKEKELSRGQPQSFAVRESTVSYGVNLLVSFFLVIFGTYSLCKYMLELSDSATFKITLIVSIIVMFAETFLLLIRMDKENKKDINKKGLQKTSFAYKFNKDYRQQFNKGSFTSNTQSKTKVD